jgi:hypothetical protein
VIATEDVGGEKRQSFFLGYRVEGEGSREFKVGKKGRAKTYS